MSRSLTLQFHPLTPDRWGGFEELFGQRGACGGCWCMSWRSRRKEFVRQKGEGNKKAMKSIVDSGQVPGILAYADDKPVAWCSLAPRETFQVLNRSRVLKRVDDKPVWSIVRFFIAKPFRRRGVSVKLLEATISYVEKRGGKIIEGYPTEPRNDLPDPFVHTGLASAFRKAGFAEVARRSKTRPIMRYVIENRQG